MTDYVYMQKYPNNQHSYPVDPAYSWGYRPGDYRYPFDPMSTRGEPAEPRVPPTNFCSVVYTPHGEFTKCTLCDVYCTGKASFDQHVMGAQHRRNAQPPLAIRCDVCDLQFTDTSQLNAHLQGSKHARKIKMAPHVPSALQNSTGGTSDSFRCEICQLDCSSQSQLDCHLSGRKHEKRVKQLKYLQTATGSPQSLKSNTSMHTTSSDITDSPHPDELLTLPTLNREIGIQTDEDGTLERIRKLESSMSPQQLAVNACSRRTDASEHFSVARHSGATHSPNPSHFCTHDQCIISRALQLYEQKLWNVKRPQDRRNKR